MPQKRFFDSDLSLDLKGSLKGQEAHHALHVMRIEEGMYFEVIDGKGALATVKALSSSKKELFYQVEKIQHFAMDSTNHAVVHLQAQLAKNKLDWVVEKSTELGSSVIIILKARGSERYPLNATLQKHLQKKMEGALKQSGRLWLPHLLFCEQIDSIDAALCSIDCFEPSDWERAHRLLLDVEDDQKSHWGQYLKGENLIQAPSIIAIGPESGWHQEEKERFEQQGYKKALMLPHCLRAETAAIAAISIVSSMQHIRLQESNACAGPRVPRDSF